MLSIVITMFVIMLIAGGIVAYVAYPHRGEELPAVPWLGEAIRKRVDALPTIDETEEVYHRR